MCDRMLQDSLRCYRGVGRGVCGDSGPGRGVGIWPPGAGWGFGPRRGVGWDSDPGCGVGWGFRPERGVGWGFGPPGAGCGGDSGPARGGDFFGKMGNFLPFCRFFAVWVEICISSRLCMILNITPTQQIRIPVKIIHIVI